MSAKSARFITFAAAAAMVGLSFAAARAQDGFTPLFNGKDLSGWKIPPATTVTGR